MIVWPRSLFEVKEIDPHEQLTDNLKVSLGIPETFGYTCLDEFNHSSDGSRLRWACSSVLTSLSASTLSWKSLASSSASGPRAPAVRPGQVFCSAPCGRLKCCADLWTTGTVLLHGQGLRRQGWLQGLHCTGRALLPSGPPQASLCGRVPAGQLALVQGQQASGFCRCSLSATDCHICGC